MQDNSRKWEMDTQQYQATVYYIAFYNGDQFGYHLVIECMHLPAT